jgi:hypothetical protein
MKTATTTSTYSGIVLLLVVSAVISYIMLLSISDAVMSNDWLTVNKLERMWQEAVVAQLKLLSRHLSRETEENNDSPQSGQFVSWSSFELDTSRIEVKSITA